VRFTTEQRFPFTSFRLSCASLRSSAVLKKNKRSWWFWWRRTANSFFLWIRFRLGKKVPIVIFCMSYLPIKFVALRLRVVWSPRFSEVCSEFRNEAGTISFVLFRPCEAPLCWRRRKKKRSWWFWWRRTANVNTFSPGKEGSNWGISYVTHKIFSFTFESGLKSTGFGDWQWVSQRSSVFHERFAISFVLCVPAKLRCTEKKNVDGGSGEGLLQIHFLWIRFRLGKVPIVVFVFRYPYNFYLYVWEWL